MEEIARVGNKIMERMIWYLSCGYSVSTVLGYFRPTSQGVFLESELSSAIDRKRLKLGVAYSMSQEMRQALADAEIDVEIQKSVSGPQLFAVISAQDAQNFPPTKLYPNTPTQVGFVLPSTAADGSVWSVTLCTQLGSNGTASLKEPRMGTMSGNFVVGDVAETPGGGDDRPVIE